MSIMLISEVRAKKAGKGRLRLWISHFSYHSFKNLRIEGGKIPPLLPGYSPSLQNSTAYWMELPEPEP